MAITLKQQQHRPPMRNTKAERKRRREAALAKIGDGHGFADTMVFVMSEGVQPLNYKLGRALGSR